MDLILSLTPEVRVGCHGQPSVKVNIPVIVATIRPVFLQVYQQSMPDVCSQEVKQILEQTPSTGASGLPEQSQLVQRLADELLQEMQLSADPAQVTSKFGPD